MKEIPQLQNKTTKFSCNNNSSQLQIINNYMFDKLFTDYLTLASTELGVLTIFYGHSIDTSIDTPLRLHRHLGQQSTNFCLMCMSHSTLSQLLTDC